MNRKYMDSRYLPRSKEELKKERENGDNGKKEDGKPRKIGGGNSGSSGSSKKTDTWTSYYNQLIKSQQSGLSELEKAYADYYSKIDEITKRASESSIVDLQQVANARLLVEQDLADKIKQIQQDAQSFIWDLTGNEIAKLQSDYQAKLDLLNTYHEQALISEESYTEAVKALYEDRESIPNMRIIWGRELPMRHFHAFLEPYPNE